MEVPTIELPKEFTIKYVSKRLGTLAAASWQRFYNCQRFSDITLLLGPQKEVFYGHKVILMLGSGTLKDLLESKKNQLNELEITLSSSDKVEIFKIILLFLYSGKVKVLANQMASLIPIANEYRSLALLEACGKALAQNVGPETIYSSLEIARTYNIQSLLSKCGRYIGENFTELRDNGILSNLDVETWIEVLKSEEIKIKGEKDLFETVVSYTESLPANKRVDALELMLPHIRFESLPNQYLVEEVELNKKLQGVKCLPQLIYKAFREKLIPELKQKRRKYSNYDFVFAQHPTLGIGTGLTIEEEGKALSKGPTGGHAMCLADVEFGPTGVYYWEICITRFVSGINIGVAMLESFVPAHLNNFVGSNAFSWDYCNNGTKIHQGSSTTFGLNYATNGTRIGVYLDCDEGKLHYFQNSTYLGLAYSLPRNKTFCPAVSLYSNCAVSLDTFVDLPQIP